LKRYFFKIFLVKIKSSVKLDKNDPKLMFLLF